MTTLSICVLCFNSERTLAECLQPLASLSEDIVVVDSGSTDGTAEILAQAGITPRYRPYDTHSSQMNYAVSQARHDWVLCLDSDEFLDARTVENIRALSLRDPATAYRLSRHWFVLGEAVHAIYPVSSPDYPVRLFNRTRVQFNDAPVDDKPTGFERTEVIAGYVRHDTFYNLHEVFKKLNDYTTRLNSYRQVKPSLLAAFTHAPAAFIKWYGWKGGFRDGKTGIVAGVYAALYTFLKYFKAWYHGSS